MVDEVERGKTRWKSRTRAKVEHGIGVIKRVFGFTKVRYRGLAKNTHRMRVACGLANGTLDLTHLRSHLRMLSWLFWPQPLTVVGP